MASEKTPKEPKQDSYGYDPYSSLKKEINKLSPKNVSYSFGKPFDSNPKVKIAK